MSLTQLLHDVFGYTTRWTLSAPELGLALLVPVVVLAFADWRVRSRR
ncbi:MAG: hypothetical protein ABJE47_17680 [bacterium]